MKYKVKSILVLTINRRKYWKALAYILSCCLNSFTLEYSCNVNAFHCKCTTLHCDDKTQASHNFISNTYLFYTNIFNLFLTWNVCDWLKRKFLSEIYSATVAIRIRIDEERDLYKQKSLYRPLHCNCNFIKKRLWSRCFPVYFAKFWRLFFTEHLYATASGPFETNLNLEAATGGVL